MRGETESQVLRLGTFSVVGNAPLAGIEISGSALGPGAVTGLPRFLRPGDVLEAEITGQGTHRNECFVELNAGPAH
jgi:2-keto-4-pentenoate hydratase/2-oxohepta-3-ene-1,7-dioic acid hydratase in catechol pathway